MPRVSVIIPAFNAAAFLEVALASVAAQTFRDFEVVVVDDRSTDGTQALAQSLLASLNLAGRVIHRPAGFRQGAGGARNAGAAVASGRILAFLDSDDAWVSGHLARAVLRLEDSAASVVAYCARASAHNPATGKAHLIPFGGYPCEGGCEMRGVLLTGMIIPNVTLCVTVDAFRRAGGYAEDLVCYEDWWLVLQLATLGKFFVDPAIGCNVLIREQSLSNTTNSRGTPAMSPAMFRDALRFVSKNYTRGGLRKNEIRVLEDTVAVFMASQLFAAMRARMPRETLTIFGLIMGELPRLPRLTRRIMLQTAGRCAALVWSKVRPFKVEPET